MATSSISIDVMVATSKLADFLRRPEEEEMILQIGKRKAKQVRDVRLPGGSGRWQLKPDWKAPTPMVDRPRTVAGSTSFHFSYISIAKQAVLTVGGEPVSGAFGKVRNPALEHSKYIERDGAAERSHGADHAAYVERDGAAELLDPSVLMSDDVERTIAAVINETPTAEEAELLGIQDVASEGIPSVFSNISDDPFERQEFWRAVERCERKPKSHQIILEPDISPAWWRELETTTLVDPDFQNHALQVAEAYRQYMAQPLADGEVRKPFKPTPFPVSAEKAGKLIEQVQRMANYNDSNPPFEFKSGRGGRIQFRMVAELPHELTAEDRALIVQNFCDHLATLQERRHLDGTPNKTGMMYTAVIHAPDAHNDSRNYHLHVVAYDRPCRFMPEHGQWDFEVAEHFNIKGMNRVRWPFRQAKLDELSRVQEGKEDKAATIGINAVPALRAKFADINNRVLKARGVKRQLDPRKYTEMGIDRTPTEHLGTKAAALESIGVATTIGQLNAIAIWSDAERAIRRQAIQAGKAYRSAQAELEGIARGMAAHDPTHPAMIQFRQLLAERQRLTKDVTDDREAIMSFDHLEAKAKSRAVRTRQTCLQFLADIETGKASRNTKALRLVIQDRWTGAQNHINSIDKALAPHREALAKSARDIEARERRILEIDTTLQPIRDVLEKRLAEPGTINNSAKPKASQASQKAAAPTSTIAPPAAKPQQPEAGRAPSAAMDVDDPAPAVPERPTIDPAATPEVGNQETAQPIEPASIEGLPIVEPTIATRQDILVEETEIETGTPEGLEPLRPAGIAEPVAAEPEVVLADLDNPLATTAPAERTQPTTDAVKADEQAPAADQPGVAEQESTPAATPIVGAGEPAVVSDQSGPSTRPDAALSDSANPAEPTAEEPKVDRRNKVQDPALVDLSNQEPRVKPRTGEAAYDDFDNLIKRIADGRIPIMAEQQPNGTLKFSVPSLAPEEREILQSTRFAHRANQRLGAMHGNQQEEIERAVRWIGTEGMQAHKLIIENKSARLGPDVTDSVRTLFRRWGKHPKVLAAFRAENQRREESAKIQAKAKPVQTQEQIDRAELKREAELIYPEPQHAYTEEVAEFTRLLRELAPDDKLREAADKIHASVRAREDIMKHTVQLATAYRKHVEGYDQRTIEQMLNTQRYRGR